MGLTFTRMIYKHIYYFHTAKITILPEVQFSVLMIFCADRFGGRLLCIGNSEAVRLRQASSEQKKFRNIATDIMSIREYYPHSLKSITERYVE